MAAHLLEIAFDGANFVYTFDGNPDPDKTQHVDSGDTIQWLSSSGAIDAKFTHGCDPTHGGPHHAAKNHKTGSNKVQGKKGDKCKYDIVITDDLGNTHSDDPQIIFDSGSLPSSITELAAIPGPAQEVWHALFTELQNVTGGGPNHDPKALFFPHGINNIQVSVTVVGVTVNITVAGPDSEGS